MTGVRLELANPNRFESPKAYVEKHLAPVVTELHRIACELLTPGSTSPEEHVVDMTPSATILRRFSRFNTHFYESSKHVVFDGAEYFSIPAELLREKQCKVQLTATVYTMGFAAHDSARFRLVREDGRVVEDSEFECDSDEPVMITRILPFGEHGSCILPSKHRYYLEGCSEGNATPVCRRFSLSFVYI